MNDDGVNLERHIKDSPFLWIGKPVVRRIREAFDASHQVASALCVYCALAEIASDGQSETFTTTQGHIAQKCGLSVRTVAARLKELTAAGLVEVNTPDLRAPSTYRLLTFGNGCATIGNGCRAFGNDRNQVTLPTLEQVENKTSEEILKKGGASKSRSTFSLSDDDWLSGLSKAPAYQGIDVPREFSKMSEWCRANRKEPTRRRFVNWLNRTDRPVKAAAQSSFLKVQKFEGQSGEVQL